MAGKALAAIGNVLSKFKIVSPFKITGVASGAEFKHYLDKAPDYRSKSPASQPIKAIVPHAEDHLVYDIKYWTRDTRREGMLVGGTGKKELVTTEFDPAAEVQKIEGMPPRPGTPYVWSKPIPYLENENNGYT